MSLNAISDLRGGVLITGGAGFVGARLTSSLLNTDNAGTHAVDPETSGRYAPVTVVDDLSVGLPMPAARPGLTCHQIDIRDHAALLAVFEHHRPSTVVHLAALHHIPSCERDPRRALDINVLGFQSVLDACRSTGCQRVLLASSGAVYAWTEGALTEQSPTAPRDVYAASKAANEHQLAAWAAATGGSGQIARMFNVIGPGDPNGHLIPDILGRLQTGSRTPVALRLGNLDTRRDFVDADDMAAGLAMLATRGWPETPGIVVRNLCSGQEYGVTDIATLLARHMGVTIEISSDPALRRANDRPSQLGDPTATLKAVGWRTTQSLDDTIRKIVAAWKPS